jgi:hypothetical protein
MGQPLDPQALRQLISDTLTPLNLYSDDVAELLLFTCANESDFGVYRVQGGGGPALGVFQMEPATFNDIFNNYLAYHLNLKVAVQQLGTVPSDMINNDNFAIVMARLQYLRASGAIPSKNDIDGIWDYYKLHYNTPLGAATKDRAMAAYNKYVLGQ